MFRTMAYFVAVDLVLIRPPLSKSVATPVFLLIVPPTLALPAGDSLA